ncbi:T9SS type A sorting domain-containing protein [Cytophagaceae bacterium YF14B1]|uniref:T9SS type A sorting domain-containing protein n=1 Tax=Xanthocytophaga flava TaxID=3048013 RepID=A0AAE3QSI2_9BACT|nr:T9SS type A sorting domain-containing protein [Xanthocytophaga flavus]MDJ1482608.1 T9SS type A sorting domain-containing protein [Xanthocytophaga flavus]
MTRKLIPIFLFLCNVLSLCVASYGQVKVEVRFKEFYNAKPGSDIVVKMYTRLKGSNDNRCANDRLGCSGCLGRNFPGYQWSDLRSLGEPESTVRFTVPDEQMNLTHASLPEYIIVRLHAWQDFGYGSTCISNNSDGDEGYQDLKVYLGSIPAGEWIPVEKNVNATEILRDDPNYQMRLQVRYVITPDPITFIGMQPNGSFCANSTITLKTGITPANLPPSPGLSYEWFYQNSGSLTWIPLRDTTNNSNTTTRPEISFNPLESIFTSGLTQKRNIRFRVRTRSKEGDLLSDAQVSSLKEFSPPPPTITALTPTISCAKTNTGTFRLQVNGIKGGQFLYQIAKGTTVTPPCDPATLVSNTCSEGVFLSGRIKSADTTFQNIGPGTYTLWTMNPDGAYGICQSDPYTFTIDSIPSLVIQSAEVQPVSCYGGKDGQIKLVVSGGAEGGVTYTYVSGPGTESIGSTNTTGIFTGLPVGVHRIRMQDLCMTLEKDVTITQPPLVSLAGIADALQVGNATCAIPGNGVVIVTVAKTADSFDKPVSTNFHYQLFQAGNATVYREAILTATEWRSENLPVGKYRLVVKEQGGADCNAYSTDLEIIAPPALGITNIQTTHVTCFGYKSGEIRFTGTGNTQGYQYQITHTTGAIAPQNNTTGIFSGLPAGDYRLTVRRLLPAGCTDSFTYPSTVVITQPSQLMATLTGKDISCADKEDGQLTLKVNGGTGTTYSYIVRRKDGVDSVTYKSGTLTGVLTVEGLIDGNYSFQATDVNGCSVFSESVTIHRPAPLKITSVNRTDIVCITDKGSIAIVAQGGIAPYQYSINNGVAFSASASFIGLSAGTYTILVKDVNGCTASYTTPIQITIPAQELSFTHTVSDYNGYQISCFGGNNGYVILQATGGNGSTYTGYSYSVDGRPYQTSNRLDGLTAGRHQLNVKDGRGCIVSQSIDLIQPEIRLGLQLVDKTNVVCAGDHSGKLTVKAVGGAAPYEFSIDGGQTYQAQALFANLAVGTYGLIAKDKNGCMATLTEAITSLYSPIEIVYQISEVNCRGGNDGTINITVSGGKAPYTYQWLETQQTSEDAIGLTAGTHTVRVTDAAGCQKEMQMNVGQPARELTFQLTTVPVCYGQTNGSIQIHASGGTPPYVYSIDNGDSFQSNTDFAVGIGTYSIRVRDSKQCQTTGSTIILQRNDQPEPGFLVASSESARDTLVITDISVPKADSLHWTFDTAAEILDSNAWAPQLRFAEAGEYTIQMTGFFGGCAYSVTKTLYLKPFDPTAPVTPVPGSRYLISLEVSPNPNDGVFVAKAKLLKKQPLVLVVIDMLGNERYRKTWDKTQEIEEHITLPDVKAGMYILRAVTENDAREVKISINH